jgi:uncharacterized protein (TIGR02246 family)
MDVQELLDRQEIDALRAAYNIAGDRGSGAGLAAVFAEDGVLEGGDGARRGRKAIEEMISGISVGQGTSKKPWQLSRHHLTTAQTLFEDAAHASGRTYFVVVTETGLDHSGVYTDRYEKRDGRWWIVHRRVRIDWAAPDGHVEAGRIFK